MRSLGLARNSEVARPRNRQRALRKVAMASVGAVLATVLSQVGVAAAAAPYWQPAPTSGYSSRVCGGNVSGPYSGVVHQTCIEYDANGRIEAFVSVANNSGSPIMIGPTPTLLFDYLSGNQFITTNVQGACNVTSLSSGHKTVCLVKMAKTYPKGTVIRAYSNPFGTASQTGVVSYSGRLAVK